ncbi:ATP-binding protein [Flavobacteriaceae bacterium TK19130]|nr:ATP-binding protein [Thermobacterium salinum]
MEKCYQALFFVFLILSATNLMGQKLKPMVVQERNAWIPMDTVSQVYEDPSRSLSFTEIQSKTFLPIDSVTNNQQATYWFRFQVKPRVATDSLQIYFYNTDISDVFIPTKNGTYDRRKIGALTSRPFEIFSEGEMYLMPLAVQEVDFNRPFYFNKKILTIWGYLNIGTQPDVLFTDDGAIVDAMLYRAQDSWYLFYLGITFISFLLFMVSYFVSGDKSFLIYSLYLLFVTLYYANRLPFFLNVYNELDPKLYYYINQITHIVNIALYFYFVLYFLDVKRNFQKVHRVGKIIMGGIVFFGVFYAITMFAFPYFEYRFVAMDLFRAVFTVSGLVLFSYMMFQKPSLIAKIILIGSVLLLLGNVAALLLKDFTFFLKMVVVEIVIFNFVVSYRNLMNEKARLRNRFALQSEKKEKEALLELDATRTRFFQNISHEFRTPLTLIQLPVTEAIRTGKRLSQEHLTTISNNAKRLLTLINDMLALSRIESGKATIEVTRGNPFAITKTLVHQFQSQAEVKKHKLLLEIDDLGITALYSANVLEKTLINLVSNALKYCGNNCVITVAASLEDSCFLLKVIDTGPGIAEKEQPHIFDRFYQVGEKDESSPGSGIGLALVKELVVLHEGSITVESKEGEGSTFTVRLPLDAIRQETDENKKVTFSPTIPETVSNQRLTSENTSKFSERPILLLVEDNLELQQYIQQFLNLEYDVRCAENGVIGWEKALEIVPDIIISDWMMPEMDGLVFCAKVKSHEATSHIPFVMLTAKADVSDRVEGLETGADVYLEKPFQLQALGAQLKSLHRHQQRLKEKYKQSEGPIPNELITNSKDKAFWEKLMDYVSTHLDSPDLSVSNVADTLGMSRMQLHRKVTSVTGQSAAEFIRSQRLQRAKKLLADANIQIAEVAYQTGYADGASFSKAFKKAFGVSPSTFQQEV